MNNVTKFALVPLLITQAHWARRRAPPLPEAAGPREGLTPWADDASVDVEGLRASGSSSQESPLRLMLVGDSSAAGVGVSTQSQALIGHLVRALVHRSGRAVHWRVIAKSGASSLEALALLEAAPASSADVAVVALGVNDLVDQVPRTRALRARGLLLRRLRLRFGVQHTVFAPVPPVEQFPLLPYPLRHYAGHEGRALDACVARWAARQEAASHVSIPIQLSREVMAIDGYHPGEPIYRQCGEALAQHICDAVLPTLRDRRNGGGSHHWHRPDGLTSGHTS